VTIPLGRRALSVLALLAYLTPGAASWLAVSGLTGQATGGCDGSTCCRKPKPSEARAACHEMADGDRPASLHCRHQAPALRVPYASAIAALAVALVPPVPRSHAAAVETRDRRPGFHRIDPLPPRSLAQPA